MKWPRRERAAALLTEYIRIDTTNPPGNEGPAVGFLARILKDAGIPFRTLSKDPARPNLIATLKGAGSKRPLILLHHTDVVAANRAEWSVDPFAGETKGGAVWGRGAFDCKGLGIMHLIVLLVLAARAVGILR